MEKEFIVETRSGSLYHLTYKHHFFEHGGRFSCKQLVGKTKDFQKDFLKVTNLAVIRGPRDALIDRSKDLNLKDVKPGNQIVVHDPPNSTSPIVKVFERIH
jgi:hypothetical protein